MPCGGIYPLSGTAIAAHLPSRSPCWVCDKGDCDCFCDEWDTGLHSACVPAFLETDEGKIVLGHGHAVIIVRDGEEVVLHEGEG